MVVLCVEIIRAKGERETFFFFPSKIVRKKGDDVAETLKCIFSKAQVSVLDGFQAWRIFDEAVSESHAIE